MQDKTQTCFGTIHWQPGSLAVVVSTCIISHMSDYDQYLCNNSFLLLIFLDVVFVLLPLRWWCCCFSFIFCLTRGILNQYSTLDLSRSIKYQCSNTIQKALWKTQLLTPSKKKLKQFPSKFVQVHDSHCTHRTDILVISLPHMFNAPYLIYLWKAHGHAINMLRKTCMLDAWQCHEIRLKYIFRLYEFTKKICEFSS